MAECYFLQRGILLEIFLNALLFIRNRSRSLTYPTGLVIRISKTAAILHKAIPAENPARLMLRPPV